MLILEEEEKKKNVFLFCIFGFYFIFKLPITQQQAAAGKRITCWFQEHLNFVISVTWSAPEHLWCRGWRRVQRPDSESRMVNSQQRHWMHILPRVTSRFFFFHHHHQGRRRRCDTDWNQFQETWTLVSLVKYIKHEWKNSGKKKRPSRDGN